MAAASGISPTQETLSIIDDLRKSKFFFATFKVEGVSIVPDVQYVDAGLKAQGDAAVATNFQKDVWPEFVKALTNADGPRFAVIDFSFNTADGRIKKTLTSVGYCPDKGTSAKAKMTFASTKTAFENKINIGKKYQANDESDLEYDAVFASIQAL